MKDPCIAIHLRVSPELMEKIDEVCGGVGTGGKHQRGHGRSGWIIAHLHEHFGLPAWEAPAAKPIPSLAGVNMDALDVKSKYIVTLYKSGLPVRSIVKVLRDKNIPTPRGGKWEAETVHNILTRAARKK